MNLHPINIEQDAILVDKGNYVLNDSFLFSCRAEKSMLVYDSTKYMKLLCNNKIPISRTTLSGIPKLLD